MAVNLILAAGDHKRWKGKRPKQLATIDDEPIIVRTARQIANHVLVVTHDQTIKDEARCSFFDPQGRRWITETLLSTRNFWTERTRVFLGDVIYSDEAITTILEFDGRIAVFGRPWEIFAISFSRGAHLRVASSLKRIVRDAETGRRGKLWEFYRAYTGLPVENTKSLENKVFQIIDDYTDDIDTIADYVEFCQENRPGQRDIHEILRWV